jgi:hypothetical protein
MQSQLLKPESGFDTLRTALTEWTEHSPEHREFRQMPKTFLGIVWNKKSFAILGVTVAASFAATYFARKKIMSRSQ